jgi:hypothetical protein
MAAMQMAQFYNPVACIRIPGGNAPFNVFDPYSQRLIANISCWLKQVMYRRIELKTQEVHDKHMLEIS